MNHKILIKIIVFVFASLLCLPAISQNKLKSKVYLYGGKEHNIFKAPKSLFDKSTDRYLSEENLMVSDFYQDLGYNIDYEIKKKNHYLDVGSDLWYRNYIENRKNNQSRIGLNGEYQYRVSKEIQAGARYKLAHSNKIGTSVVGDDLIRSFIYIQNKPEVFITYNRSKKSSYGFSTSFDHKNYYKDTTSRSLNYYNLKFELAANYKLLKKHKLGIKAYFTDRHYSEYNASDAKGKVKDAYPMRHFQYWGTDLIYKHNFSKKISLSPFTSIIIREDLYESFFSYFSYKFGLRAKYKYKKLSILAEVSHKKFNYSVRNAPSYDEVDPALEYAYIAYRASLTYQISKSFDAYAAFSSDSRDSNTELEHWKTRRAYNRYEFMLGVNYTFRK
jgi:hypothetical protein